MAATAATATMETHIRLAQTLHPRLLAFFTKFPPPPIAATPTNAISPSEPTTTTTTASNTSPSDPNALPTTPTPPTTPANLWPANAKNSPTKQNPFLPFRNQRTGNWHAPHYSLRRQAQLFKLASLHNVLPLMPHSPKHPEIRAAKRAERASRTLSAPTQDEGGIGVGFLPVSGKKAKGHKWERMLRGKMEERRRAMEGMPEMVREWKLRGHGRGWKKWPR